MARRLARSIAVMLITSGSLACDLDFASLIQQIASQNAASPQTAAPSPGDEEGICEDNGPVVVLVVEEHQRLKEMRAREPSTEVVSGDANTIVYGDGRILTTSLEGVGAHLEKLGWSDRQIEIEHSFREQLMASRSRSWVSKGYASRRSGGG